MSRWSAWSRQWTTLRSTWVRSAPCWLLTPGRQPSNGTRPTCWWLSSLTSRAQRAPSSRSAWKTWQKTWPWFRTTGRLRSGTLQEYKDQGVLLSNSTLVVAGRENGDKSCCTSKSLRRDSQKQKGKFGFHSYCISARMMKPRLKQWQQCLQSQRKTRETLLVIHLHVSHTWVQSQP